MHAWIGSRWRNIIQSNVDVGGRANRTYRWAGLGIREIKETDGFLGVVNEERSHSYYLIMTMVTNL
jgi:hypothetical protein